MKAKVALNLHNLSDNAKLSKLETSITKLTGNVALPDPNPTLIVAEGKVSTARKAMEAVQIAENDLREVRILLEQAMDDVVNTYEQLATYVENKSNGDEAIITGAGFEVVAPRKSVGPAKQVVNLVLTAGDNEGSLDAAWDRDPAAKSYEIQISVDPMSSSSWKFQQVSGRSSATINGLISGTKTWARVRSIGGSGPGPWSDPAVKTVP